MAKKLKLTNVQMALIIGALIVLLVIIYKGHGVTGYATAKYVEKSMPTAGDWVNGKHIIYYIDAWGHAPNWKGWTDCLQQSGGRALADRFCQCNSLGSTYGEKPCYHEWKKARTTWDITMYKTNGVKTCSYGFLSETGEGEAFTKIRCNA